MTNEDVGWRGPNQEPVNLIIQFGKLQRDIRWNWRIESFNVKCNECIILQTLMCLTFTILLEHILNKQFYQEQELGLSETS